MPVKKVNRKKATRKKAMVKAKNGAVKVNGYTVNHNPMFNEYSVTHPDIGYCTGFKLKRDAISYAKNG